MSIPGDPRQWRVGLVGYGEVGRILAEDLREQGVAVAAYDVKLGTAADAPLRQHAAQHDVSLAASHAELASQADFIVSAVTASQTVAVAESCAPASSGTRSSSISTRRRPAPRSGPPVSSTPAARATSRAPS